MCVCVRVCSKLNNALCSSLHVLNRQENGVNEKKEKNEITATATATTCKMKKVLTKLKQQKKQRAHIQKLMLLFSARFAVKLIRHTSTRLACTELMDEFFSHQELYGLCLHYFLHFCCCCCFIPFRCHSFSIINFTRSRSVSFLYVFFLFLAKTKVFFHCVALKLPFKNIEAFVFTIHHASHRTSDFDRKICFSTTEENCFSLLLILFN